MKFVWFAYTLIFLTITLFSQNNPVPLINTPLVPTSTAPGGAGFSLTVNGSGFVPGSVVNWNGRSLATTFVSGSQLTGTVPASDIATSGTAVVSVVNPIPGGGTSNPQVFDVRQAFIAASFDLASYSIPARVPNWVLTVDVNGDGNLDMVTTDTDESTISVLLGNGDGTFQPQISYAVAEFPLVVLAGDFNKDSKLDLAVSSEGDVVSLLLGNGDGTFQAHLDVALGGAQPFGLATGDFNSDGNLDIVAAISSPVSEIAILLGNGDGTFQSAVTYTAGSSAADYVTVGDFNRDGKLDLAVTVNGVGGTDAAIFLGKGDGSFQNALEFPAEAGAEGIVAADFNGDGNLDLATMGNGSGAFSGDVSVLLGNGDGTFQTQVNYSTKSIGYGIATGDLNGDGKLDLVVTNIGGTNRSGLPAAAATFLGRGDGTFAAPGYFATGFPVAVAVGDFNGDGMLDITATISDAADVLLQSTSILSKTNVTFPNTKIGSSAKATVTLSNVGTSSLTISKIGLNGQDKSAFSETSNCGTTLPPGGSCAIKLVFTPTSAKQYIGVKAEIVDSSVNVPQIIYIQGTGIN